jgi:hypothetical protein
MVGELMDNNKTIKKLAKAYDKKAKLLNKNFSTDLTTGLALFVTQLKYIRDLLILAYEAPEEVDAYPFEDFSENKIEIVKDDTDEKIAVLITAIAEFEAYLQTKDRDQKAFHWDSFWEFIKLNAEDWLELDDTI